MGFKDKKDEHDRPLSYYWNTRRDALDFLGRAADDEVIRSIVTHAYLVGRDDPECWISYSRRKPFYSRSRYRLTKYTYTTVVRAVDFLAENWIEHNKMLPGSLGWQSSFRGSPTLMAAMPSDVAFMYEPTETLILRGRVDKNRIEYRDNRDTYRMRRNLSDINEMLGSVEIGHPNLGIIRTGDPTRIEDANPGPARQTLARIFTDNFEQNGRFYGAFWINMKGKERVRLTIDGESVIEHDYKAIHPTLLYAEAGLGLAGDPYAIPGYEGARKLVKVAFNTAVNAKQRNTAAWSIKESAEVLANAGQIPSNLSTLPAAFKLLDAIEEHHAPIRAAFCSDMGVKLMRSDSRIAEDVLLDLTGKGIVTLPVHDSFIVPAERASQLKESMEKAMHKEKCRLNPYATRQISPRVPHITGDHIMVSPTAVGRVALGGLDPAES